MGIGMVMMMERRRMPGRRLLVVLPGVFAYFMRGRGMMGGIKS